MLWTVDLDEEIGRMITLMGLASNKSKILQEVM